MRYDILAAERKREEYCETRSRLACVRGVGRWLSRSDWPRNDKAGLNLTVVETSPHHNTSTTEHQSTTTSTMTGDEDTTRPTTNSAGVIRPDGHARVQVGNSYSIVHNYPDSNRYLADSHLAETDKAKVRTEFLQRLFTSPYENRKNRNPKRANGTCEWFTAHRLFQNWRKETSALLWVSADPGCGKSVLARYLVDDLFPSNPTRTTCYFFFKDDFEDQRVLEGAVCCILHQLFTQKPALLSDDILEDFREEGDQLFASFPKLWDILIGATRNHNHGDIICILDALDECVDQTRLAKALTQHYSKGKEMSTLKFLVTSRPYLRIRQDFRNLEESHPTIHLSGESEEEIDKIAQEIAITINQRIEESCERLQLSIHEKQILQAELAAVHHRTYLWVHLVFPVIETAVFLSKSDLIASIRNLPRTVEEAYDNILRKSQHPVKAKKILHTVVAAVRPLHLTEMAAVLAFQKSHRWHKDLEQDLVSPERLHVMVREACGLFVVIQDSRVFLLHQTAREFLIQTSLEPSEVRSPFLKWQHSLDLKESHRLLSEICIRYLLLADPEEPVGAKSSLESEDRRSFVFLEYAACSWADHYRHVPNTHDTDLERLALQLCDTNSGACSRWLKVYGEKRMRELEFPHELPTSLLIASYFGLNNLVNLILRKSKKSLDATGTSNQRTALSWASEKGYYSIVRSLLDRVPKHEVILRDKLSSSSPTIVNRKDKLGRSPLWYSAANGHQSVVQHLLKRGAKVDARDENGLPPLSWATHHGHNDVVTLLLENGARQDSKSSHLETRDRYGRTPLLNAANDGNEVVVQLLLNGGAKLLLDGGAKVDATSKDGWTALIGASDQGHDAVVKLLLDGGAKVDAASKNGWTALINASYRGHDAVVKLLLDGGAKVDAAGKDGWTALINASDQGHDAVVKLLLDGGAKVDATSKDGWTALMNASDQGHDAVVKLLLDGGAKIDAADKNGWTALIGASYKGHDAVVKLLLDGGAKVYVTGKNGWTALKGALNQGHDAVIKLLLDGGVEIY
ncbi:hypothetical protein SUNI508_05076 [Seiridium unicorne]|uniref:Uncharacterized protein n=1 Tax=Seiridium unicorne TaxID=138068 RepID=A0ABR2V617_9PEZI